MLKYVKLTCVFMLSAFALPAQVVDLPAVRTTGMVGIAFGETAQLNLLNPGVAPPATGVVCTASVAFIDAAGTVLKTGTVTADPGKSASLALQIGVDAQILTGDRRQIRATIAMPVVPPPTATATTTTPVTPGCKLIPTLEILDSVTGRTQVVLGRVEAVPSVVAANR